MGEQRGLAPLLTVDLAPVTVELNLRESGARFPCKWSSVLEIYINHLFLVKVVFHLLVVLGKQLLSGLVGSSGNSRAALASLDDADFQMRYWHLGLNLLSMVQKKTDTFQYGRAGRYSLVVGE